jgi:hypothetical protein
VNGSLHGYEIKSDSDTTDRLDHQIQQYEGVFDFLTVVCGHRLLASVREKVPQCWGIMVAENNSGAIRLRHVRKARKNPRQRTADLARMLWRKEALACLRRYGHFGLSSKCSAEEIWTVTAASLNAKVLANETRLAIKARGGSGFARTSAQGDGSYTIGSNIQLENSSMNLAWLLSHAEPNPLR